MNMYEGKLIMYACIIRETFVFTVFRRVFHSILKLKLCRHACRRRDQIIPTCRYEKNMPTTALPWPIHKRCFSIFIFVLTLESVKCTKINAVQKLLVIQKMNFISKLLLLSSCYSLTDNYLNSDQCIYILVLSDASCWTCLCFSLSINV